MIDKQTIDRIMDTVQIVDVVSDFVQLRKRGVNFIGLCPFHDEKTPSFSVSPSRGICKCFSCGKGGNAAHFIMEHEQLTYPEALRYLAKKYGIEIVEKELTDEQRQSISDRESMFIINAFAQQYFSDTLTNTVEGKDVGLAYFHERGFRDDIIRKFQLGYCSEQRDGFTSTALIKGYKREFLEKTGLSVFGENNYQADRFRGRVMFPVHTISGKVVAFGGRVLKSDAKLAKYVNSPDSEIYHKSSELYGLYLAKQSIVKSDCCYLVEGYTDVISMHQAGIENVVASSGTALTPGQIRLIHRFSENITVLYDGDAAGIKASIRGIDLLLQEGMNVKVLLLPGGEDPDSFARGRSASEFIEYIKANETDFIRFKSNLLLEESGKDPIKLAALITDMVKSIALIPDSIKRSVYAKECSMLFGVNEQMLLNEIKRTILVNKEKASRPQPMERSGEQSDQPADLAIDNSPLTESINPIQQSDTYRHPASNETVKIQRDTSRDQFERNLIRLIVRYGEKKIEVALDDDETQFVSLSLLDYIRQELQLDEIEFQHPLYKRVFEEAVANSTKAPFEPNRYFCNHPSSEMSRLAVDLIQDRYQLSKLHSKHKKIETEEDNLYHFAYRAILELKNAILSSEFNQVNRLLKEACERNDPKAIEYMEELKSFDEIRKELAKRLGERIVTK